MANKKKISVYRMNLVSVGIGQGEMETLPYLYNETEYTPSGEMISQSSYSTTGLLVEKMAYQYDKGRVISQFYFTEPGEPSEVIHYERNEKGEVVKDVRKYLDGSFDTTSYVYDEQGRLKEKITVDNEGVTDLKEQYVWQDKLLLKHEAWDAEGNIISLGEYKYDDRGNVIEFTQTDEDTGENRRTVSVYDQTNHKTSDEIFDEEGELLEKITYVNDKSGKLISSEYDSPQKWSSTEYHYDEQGNNLGHTETDEEGNQLVSVEHTYDENNNRTGSIIFSNGGTLATNQHFKLMYEYEWYEK